MPHSTPGENGIETHACGTCTLSTPPLPTLVGKNDRCSGKRVYNTGRLLRLPMHPNNKRCFHKAAKPNEWRCSTYVPLLHRSRLKCNITQQNHSIKRVCNVSTPKQARARKSAARRSRRRRMNKNITPVATGRPLAWFLPPKPGPAPSSAEGRACPLSSTLSRAPGNPPRCPAEA